MLRCTPDAHMHSRRGMCTRVQIEFVDALPSVILGYAVNAASGYGKFINGATSFACDATTPEAVETLMSLGSGSHVCMQRASKCAC